MAEKELLTPDTVRQTGRNAQKNNILAAKIIADTIKTTLGPKGMDKMLVSQMGDVIVTNDGVTILEEIAIDHPTAKMITDIARTQEDEVGDGTTTAVILAGELLSQAQTLLDKNIHPTVIIKGFQQAQKKTLQILSTIAEPIKANDEKVLQSIAKTAMTGKGAEVAKELLAKLTTQAVLQLHKPQREHIRVETITGKSLDQSEIIQGMLIDKAIVHADMPKTISEPKILLLNSGIQIKDTETDAKITINNPQQIESYLEQEERMIKAMVEKIAKSGANLVICQKGIDELAQHYLAKHNIAAVRRVKKSDIDMLSQSLNARIVTNIADIQLNSIGVATKATQRTINNEQRLQITGMPYPTTLLIASTTDHVAQEMKRAIEDAIGDIISTLHAQTIVGGAGAVDIELSQQIKQYAQTLSGREQLAVIAFAKALETIPAILADNAGLDPIDVMTSLKAAHAQNNKWAGIDVLSGNLVNTKEEGIIEPSSIKRHAIESATQVANMILRIDDIIAAGPPPEYPDPSQMVQ